MGESTSKTGFTDLIHWKNPIVSGVALAVFDIGLIVIARVMTNLSTFLCSMGMLAIFAGGVFKFTSPPTGKPVDIVSENQCKAIAKTSRTPCTSSRPRCGMSCCGERTSPRSKHWCALNCTPLDAMAQFNCCCRHHWEWGYDYTFLLPKV